MEHIEKILENIGLNKRQAKVYLACLEFGPIGITKLAKQIKEKKTTTFDVVKNLLDKKIINIVQEGKRKLYISVSPKVISSVYEDKINKFNSIVPLLSNLEKARIQNTLVRYYHGRDGLKQVFEDILNCKNKHTKYWGSLKICNDVLGSRYLKSWIRRRIRRGIKSRALRIKTEEIKDDIHLKQKEYLREIRYAPNDLLTGSNLSIYDNKVAFIASKQEGFGFIVESQEFHQMMENIFDAFWKVGEPKA